MDLVRPPYRKFVVVGERAAVGELVEWEFVEQAHEELRDALCPGFWDASEAEKERLDAETVYGWITGSGERLVVRMDASYEPRAQIVLGTLSGWAGEQGVTLAVAFLSGERPGVSPAEDWSLTVDEGAWARRRPWAVTASGEVLLGAEGQFHAELAASHDLRADQLVALGEVLDGRVHLFRGERRWLVAAEAALEAGAD